MEYRFLVEGDLPRVGVMKDDRVVMPRPPIRRAVEVVVEKLKSSGMEMVDVDVNSFDWLRIGISLLVGMECQ